MEIVRLNAEEYSGKKYSVKYESMGYYNIQEQEDSFEFKFYETDKPEEHVLQDEILADWLENPVAYGAFEDNKLLGYVEGYLETWNNRFRISNIVIFDKSWRNAGIGTKLFQKIVEDARKSGARMVFLETQSCNTNAIAFYKKMGFKVIGFDQYAYSNEGPQNHEMLVWMGQKL